MNKNNKGISYKKFPAFQLKLDPAQGIVEHIVAVMGNVDAGNDRIHNGAFTKTITERGVKKIRVLDNHRQDSIMSAIGKPNRIYEIERNELPAELLTEFPEATGALVAETQFLMNTPEGYGAFERIQQGAVDEYSIGYQPVKGATEFTSLSDGRSIRELKEIKLFEYGPVLFGMNEATRTVSAKAADDEPEADPETDEKDLMLHDIEEDINQAFYSQFFQDSDDEFGGYWINRISLDPQYIIVSNWREESEFNYYQIDYTVDDDMNYSFAPMEDWRGGAFVFVAGAKMDVSKLVAVKTSGIIKTVEAAPQREQGAATKEADNDNPELAGPEITPPTTKDDLLKLIEIHKAKFDME